MPHAPDAAFAPRRARRVLWPVLAVLTAVGFLAVGGVAAGRVYWELHRDPTKAELDHAAAVEVGRRWRTWPAGKIFPATVTYVSAPGGVERARRIGIAPETGCSTGIAFRAAAILRQYHCRALLRATYVDQLQGIVITVGIAAFPDARRASRATVALAPADRTAVDSALRALSFPDTMAARFTDAAREYVSVGRAGPYAVLTVAGRTDGRPSAEVEKKRVGAFSMAAEIGGHIGEKLARPARPDCRIERTWRC